MASSIPQDARISRSSMRTVDGWKRMDFNPQQERVMATIDWTASEKKAARLLFNTAHERVRIELLDEVRKRTEAAKTISDLGQLHNFLTERLDWIDLTFDFRYSQLLFVFAALTQQEIIRNEELDALGDMKAAQIRMIASL